MPLDQDRIRAVLKNEHGYYTRSEFTTRQDKRWSLGWYSDFIAKQLSPTSRVLDIGCGKGHILMDVYESCPYAYGLGVDNDPEFLHMAEEARRAAGITNIDFLLLDFPRQADRLEPESFDMVMCIRGPMGDTAGQAQAAYRLLRPDGMLFTTQIAELHHQEVKEIFEPDSFSQVKVRQVDRVRSLLAGNGFDVRLAADLLDKEFYPDFYAWLQAECDIRSWLGIPLPEPDDPRLERFAERNTIPTGEIETTNHVCWVAGVKK